MYYYLTGMYQEPYVSDILGVETLPILGNYMLRYCIWILGMLDFHTLCTWSRMDCGMIG